MRGGSYLHWPVRFRTPNRAQSWTSSLVNGSSTKTETGARSNAKKRRPVKHQVLHFCPDKLCLRQRGNWWQRLQMTVTTNRRHFLQGTSAALVAGSAPRAAWGRTEVDVVIIGAGLAGLMAAHKLEAAGLKIVIVEGEKRVGGRLHTLDDLPGRPEAGGIQVGTGCCVLSRMI